MADSAAEATLRVLRRTRQIRRFTDAPVDETALRAILEVARWSGSSMNSQPWTFVVLRDPAIRASFAETRYARHVAKAPLAIAIVMPGRADPETEAYDEGRVAERIMIAASAQGLGAGIGWTDGEEERSAVAELLGLKPPAFVRTIVALGHPTEEALRPRSGPGTGRRPLGEFVRDR